MVPQSYAEHLFLGSRARLARLCRNGHKFGRYFIRAFILDVCYPQTVDHGKTLVYNLIVTHSRLHAYAFHKYFADFVNGGGASFVHRNAQYNKHHYANDNRKRKAYNYHPLGKFLPFFCYCALFHIFIL